MLSAALLRGSTAEASGNIESTRTPRGARVCCRLTGIDYFLPIVTRWREEQWPASASWNCALATAALSEGESPLTEREHEVLAMTARGESIAVIAGALSLSEGAVRNYLSEAIQKLGAQNWVEAARIAEQRGWL